MKHTVDLKKYNTRTDLIIDNIDNFEKSKSKETNNRNTKITKVVLNKEDALKINKKPGIYFTIEFDDITDTNNQKDVLKAFEKCLKSILKNTKINDDMSCLIIGLGNRNSTPDSLGPLVINDIIVTRHIFLLSDLDPKYRVVSAYTPGVMGESGIETIDIITGIINKIKPDFLIVIDALASSSIERVNKTIQMSNTGINPGSGIGNNQKELSYETLNIPVISIGIPTVVDAISIVSDTIYYMQKHYAFSKKFLNNPLSRIVKNVNYLKENIEINKKDKEDLLGLIGHLSNEEVRMLLNDVLTPIGYNMIVTPKEIDFVINKLANTISSGINNVLKKTT